MDPKLLCALQGITAEEQAFLDGRTTIDRDLYMQGQDNTINARKLLDAGKLITIRPNTRFIDFPEHTHDYVEMVYMCTGRTTHRVNGEQIDLVPGDLLLLSQSARHSVARSGQQDVGVNFIVLPEFFATTLTALGQEETPLRSFLLDCLCGKNTGPGYLHFAVSQVKPIQNLIENLLWALLEESQNRHKMSQMTMALLFLQLMEQTQTLQVSSGEDAAIIRVLQYVESNYHSGSLAELSRLLHYDLAWLSRHIKRKTGRTYTQLIQERRLSQAAFLLKNTRRNVDDICAAVGYENISYFHRLFFATYGCTPKEYRRKP